MRIAALDLGSNTSLLLVVDIEKGRITKIVRDELRVTRMGQGVHQNRTLHPEALERVDRCFKEYAEIIKASKVDHVLAMATSAARDVTNAEELFKIGHEHGIEIEIIPGAKEAEITFKGSTFEEPKTKGLCVIDVGGGSTEIIGCENGTILHGASVDIGSVRLTEMFVKSHPIANADLATMKIYIQKKLQERGKEIELKNVKEVIAVAGTPTTLAAVMSAKPYSHEVVHGFKIQLTDLYAWAEKLAKMTVEDRMALPGMDKKRADVIVAGLLILAETTAHLGRQSIRVSDRGVRFGVALHAFERFS
jgi:exopolyphosphatase/guanosine-5'-triphosphate,3'-diphosphate pyrophosphatase